MPAKTIEYPAKTCKSSPDRRSGSLFEYILAPDQQLGMLEWTVRAELLCQEFQTLALGHALSFRANGNETKPQKHSKDKVR